MQEELASRWMATCAPSISMICMRRTQEKSCVSSSAPLAGKAAKPVWTFRVGHVSVNFSQAVTTFSCFKVTAINIDKMFLMYSCGGTLQTLLRWL